MFRGVSRLSSLTNVSIFSRGAVAFQSAASKVSPAQSCVTTKFQTGFLTSFSTSTPEKNQSNCSQKNEKTHQEQGEQGEQKQQGEQKKKRSPFEQYTDYLNTHPFITKAITSAFIVSAGDIFAQLAIERTDQFNFKRFCTMGVMGGIVIAPTLHFWYGALNRYITAQTTMGAVTRMLADQFLFAPLFIPVIFGFMFSVEGRIDQLEEHLRKNWWDTTLANWKLWIPAQFITFRFIPVNMQVNFVNLVALGWNTYVSWKGHQVTEHVEVNSNQP